MKINKPSSQESLNNSAFKVSVSLLKKNIKQSYQNLSTFFISSECICKSFQVFFIPHLKKTFKKTPKLS